MTSPSPTQEDLRYSGASHPGYNEHGTYDRIIWDGSGEFLSADSDVCERLRDCIDHFRTSSASRLVARLRMSDKVDTHAIRGVLPPECELAVRPELQEGRRHLTLGLNAPKRAVPREDIAAMQATVQRRIDALSTVDFPRHAIALRHRCREEGLTFHTDPSADEIHRLWKHSFGWTREQCEAYAASPDPSSRIFLLRNDVGEALSGLLVADGESTEWATLPAYQGLGLIVPLLLYANCALIHDRMESVFAELRWNRSIGPALLSGFSIDRNNGEPWLLTNHVTIGDAADRDPPDPWNCERPRFNGTTDGRMLRTFAVAHLHPETFHDDILASYLS